MIKNHNSQLWLIVTMGNYTSNHTNGQRLFDALAAYTYPVIRVMEETHDTKQTFINQPFDERNTARIPTVTDINHVYKCGDYAGTLLGMACASSQVDVINKLLDTGCDVNTNHGDTNPLDIICKDLMFVTSIEDHTQYDVDAVHKVILRMISMGATTKRKGTILTLLCAPSLEDAGLAFVDRHTFSTDRTWWLQLIFLLCGTGQSEKIVEQLIQKVGIDDIDFRTVMGKNIYKMDDGWTFQIANEIDDNYLTLIDNVKANGWKTVLKLLTDVYRKMIVASMENGYSGDVVNLMLEYFIS